MPSLARSGVWLLAASLGNAIYTLPQMPDPRTTDPARLELRDVDSMVGVFITDNTYQTMYCNPGRTPIDISGHVLCSSPGVDPPNATTAVTACSDSFALFGTTSYACTFPTTCGSMRLLLSTGAPSTATWIACGTGLPSVIYRNPPSITGAPSTGSSTTGTSTSTAPPSPTPAPSSSQAWIAGPVIGGVVALALIGFLVWWLLRRKRQKKLAASGVNNTDIHKTESPPVMSQWSSPNTPYVTPQNQLSSTSPGQGPPYQGQYPPPSVSPSQGSQYPLAPSPGHGSYFMEGSSPPPGQYPMQQAQWQAPAPIHEMPAHNYDGPAELSGHSGPYEAPSTNR